MVRQRRDVNEMSDRRRIVCGSARLVAMVSDPIQHAPNFCCQRCVRERFLDQVDADIQSPLVDDCVAGITRHEENL